MVFRAIWGKIKQGLTKTRTLFGGLAMLFRLRGRVDKAFLAELEKTLYLADSNPGGNQPRSTSASPSRSPCSR